MPRVSGIVQLLLLIAVVCVASAGASAQDQPEIVLRVPDFDEAAYPNSASIRLPSAATRRLELVLRAARGELQLSSVRIRLNGESVTAFATINPMPRGIRVILDLSRMVNPAFQLRPEVENSLLFEALDDSRNKYVGNFFLTVKSGLIRPERVQSAHATERSTVQALPAFRPPEIKWNSVPPGQTAEATLLLEAEVLDEHGLRRVVIELNQKDVEIVLLENSVPIRKRGTFRTNKALPGTVEGTGRHLLIRVPLELKKKVNVLAIRAENLKGLYASTSHTITRSD